MIGGWEIILLLVVLPVLLACFAFWVWMLVDCIRNPRLTDNQRLIWVLVIVFTHWIGALIYFFAGRSPRTT